MDCTLIEFTQEFKDMSSHRVHEVILWLGDNAGHRNEGWRWLRGDIRGNGVYILDSQVALIFVLKYPELVLRTSPSIFPALDSTYTQLPSIS